MCGLVLETYVLLSLLDIIGTLVHLLNGHADESFLLSV